MRRSILLAVTLLALGATASRADNPGQANAPTTPADNVFQISRIATLKNPWAMVFLPDRSLLVTQKSGQLRLVGPDGLVSDPIPGVPAVSFHGQNGLLDVALHPNFAANRLVYLSFDEPGPNHTSGLAVGRGRFVNGQLKDFQVIFRDEGKVGEWQGQTAGRLAFAPDGTLFVSSGERQLFTPAQDMATPQGKVLHMTASGRPLGKHPFTGADPVTAYIWTLGHRNPLGMAFDPTGRLWVHENGPQGGDELNLIVRGANYGWPVVSNGTNYGDPPGTDTIPNHDTHPEFAAPKVWWNPSIAPSGLIIYTGDLFPAFKGDAILGALAGQELSRVDLNGDAAVEVARYSMGTRIREVEQGPDGAIYLLEDAAKGRLLRLAPKP